MTADLSLLTPKQREIRERPGLIVACARRIVREEGYLALTIDRIARAMDCSRPPIYEIFESKEDILMAVALEDSLQRYDLFRLAAQFRGNARERLTAVGLFTARTYPEHLRILSILHPNSVRQRASKRIRDAVERSERRPLQVITGIVRDAIAEGNLVLPPGQTPAHVTYAIFCLSFGGYTQVSRDNVAYLAGFAGIKPAVRMAMTVLLDGFGWRPLSSDYDYAATVARVKDELDIDGAIARTEALKGAGGMLLTTGLFDGD